MWFIMKMLQVCVCEHVKTLVSVRCLKCVFEPGE